MAGLMPLAQTSRRHLSWSQPRSASSRLALRRGRQPGLERRHRTQQRQQLGHYVAVAAGQRPGERGAVASVSTRRLEPSSPITTTSCWSVPATRTTSTFPAATSSTVRRPTRPRYVRLPRNSVSPQDRPAPGHGLADNEASATTFHGIAKFYDQTIPAWPATSSTLTPPAMTPPPATSNTARPLTR